MKINRERVLSLIPHIIGLFFVTIIPLFIFDTSDEKIRFWTYRYYYQLFFLIIAFYGNYLFITPKFFYSKKKISFFLTLLIFSVSLLTISQISAKKLDFIKPPGRLSNQRELRNDNGQNNVLGLHPRILDDTFFLILIFGFSTGMSILQKLRNDEQKQQKLEKVNVENELAFLKNQINPHFFFNSLNNIYALIDIDGDQAQKTIETLSGLMRYLIYESDTKKVPLKNEFDFSRNYIELMRQRLSAKVKLTVDINEDVPDVEIPPLLFISFIENAFKHGVSYRGDSFIDIKMLTNSETVVFQCRNSIPHTNDSHNNTPGGIGISNIKKRLEILYGESAHFTIEAKEDIFMVELIIPI